MARRIMKRLLLVCAMILSVAVRAAADNTVSIGSAQGAPGDTVTLQIGLANSDNVSSVQISIPVDSRLELVENSAAGTARTSQHSVTAGVKDGKLNIFVYSVSMGDIAAGNGAIATVKLKLGNEPSSITLGADKAILTDNSGTALQNPGVTAGNVTILCAKAEYGALAIDYGRVPIRSTYRQTVRINNTGNVPLVVSGVQFSAEEFSCSETFPFEIAAGEGKDVAIDYAPTERGSITEEVKFINNSVYKLNTVKLQAQPFAVNELHVEEASGVADSTITITLRMNNMDAITGLQLDFSMPEQLEYVDGSFALSARKADHQLAVSLKERSLRVIAYSLSDTPFSGDDGTIATFKVRLDGRYGTSLEAQKAILTANIKGKETDVLSDKYAGYINILSPCMSTTDQIDMGRTPITQDARASFQINNYGSAPLRIERIVSSSEHLKTDCSLPLVIEPGNSAEVNVILDDIEERDYDELLQLYTNDPGLRMHNIKVTGNRYSPNYFTLSAADVEPGDTLKLRVALSNNDPVNGLQFDMQYNDDNFELLDETEWAERASGYSLTRRDVGNGTMRCFCYSLDGKEISKGEGDVLTLQFAVNGATTVGAYGFSIDNILLSTPGLVDKYSGAGNSIEVNVIKPVRTISVADAEHGTVNGVGTYDRGAEVTLTAVPDEGYSFVSWSDGNTDNPRTVTADANMVISATFSPNSYTLKYVVDGNVYKSDTVDFGTAIAPEETPAREGYTFGGWSEIPETMPAHDVTVSGSFAVNSYILKYVVDGKEYKSDSIEFGATIAPEETPAREGYTFGGWSEIPETMPAHDVTVSGSFAVNSYILKYVVDGKEYKSDTVDFGTAIAPEEIPAREGYTFGGWSEIPETMPAHDVMVEGTFSANIHKVTWMIDGDVMDETEVKYGEAIIAIDVLAREGYTFEGWSDIPETMPDYDIVVNGSYTPVSSIETIMADKERVSVYTIQGFLVGKNMTLQEIRTLPKGYYIINRKCVLIGR